MVLMLVASVFFPGLIQKTKAVLSGRKGASVVQFPLDLLKLAQKSPMYSHTTSFVFKLGPLIYLSSVLCALMVIPFNTHLAIFSFEGDFIFFAYILGVGRFFMVLSAIDTGSPFEGMGANREALYSMLAEPAFFILMGSFAMFTGHASFYDIFQAIHNYSDPTTLFLILLSVVILVQLAMIENSRMPVDDPKTHLELTMIHEVMVLDHSGFDLACIMWAASLKFVTYGMIIVNLLVETHMNELWQMVVFVVAQVAFALTVGVLESFRARERMKNNPSYIFTLTVLATMVFFGVILLTKSI